MKEMIGKDKISEIVKKIASGYNPDKIILFGSYAMGNPNETIFLSNDIVEKAMIIAKNVRELARQYCIFLKPMM